MSPKDVLQVLLLVALTVESKDAWYNFLSFREFHTNTKAAQKLLQMNAYDRCMTCCYLFSSFVKWFNDYAHYFYSLTRLLLCGPSTRYWSVPFHLDSIACYYPWKSHKSKIYSAILNMWKCFLFRTKVQKG